MSHEDSGLDDPVNKDTIELGVAIIFGVIIALTLESASSGISNPLLKTIADNAVALYVIFIFALGFTKGRKL